MSIINEALQKAGGIKNKGTEGTSAGLKKNIIQPHVIINKIPRYKLFYAAGIIIFLVIVIFYSLQGNKIQVQENAIPAQPVIIAEPEIIREIPTETAVGKSPAAIQHSLPNQTEFNLTGIVLGEGAPMAIINDSVYISGDMIKDLKIVEIKKNTVSLEKDGRKIELRVK
jgi:hypothetical protein